MQNKNTLYLLITLIVLVVMIGGTCLYVINNNQVKIVEYKQDSYKDNPSNITVTEIPQEEAPIEKKNVGDENLKRFFTSNTPAGNEVSNVVGYFAGGAFLTYVPQWMVENWSSGSNVDGSVTTFSPKDSYKATKDFSDIVIKASQTDETYNAEWLFQSNKSNSLVAEVILNVEGDMRIYHIEKQDGDNIQETFYIDGDKKTGIFIFSASQENYYKYNVRVKEFIQGLRKGGVARG